MKNQTKLKQTNQSRQKTKKTSKLTNEPSGVISSTSKQCIISALPSHNLMFIISLSESSEELAPPTLVITA